MTSTTGLAKAMAAVQGPDTLLWASIPCTGGSQTWTKNIHNVGGPEKLEEHRKLFRMIWKNFELVARECVQNGGMVAIEWPSYNTYWRLPAVQKLVKELRLKRFRINGCAMGVKGGP